MRRTRAVVVVCTCALLAFCGQALASGITNSGDDLRTGWYPNEAAITPQLVGGGTFGQMWSTPVEGQVYAQPLLDNGTVLVATENNKVYGLSPSTGALQWAKPLTLGTPWSASDIGCGDLAPTIGVTATPVIDPATHIAYMTHKTYASGTSGPARWYMDAVDVATGAEEPGFPVLLSGTAQNAPEKGSAQSFEATTELQRPGLLLLEGVVYAAFGSSCDHWPWQGWVFGVSTTGQVKARWVADEEGAGAGIWQSGAGLTSDGPGNILVSTGNGGAPSTPTPGNTPPGNLGEAVVRLHVQGDGSLKATDFFAPFDAATLDTWDADFASGGVTGLPEASFGTAAIPHLAVAVGKSGYVYLLNRDNLGGIGQGQSGSDNVVQRVGPYGGVWSRPGVWPGEGGWVYIPTASGGTSASGSSGNLRVYKYGLSGTGSPTLSLQGTSSDAFGFSTSAPVITSDGTTSGSALVWLVWAPNGGGSGAQLRAYDPVPVGGKPVLRWSGPVGTSSKFAMPGVGAGRLYVGTRDGHVLGFGSPVTPVLTGPSTAFPTTTVGESSERTLTLTATEALTLSSLESSSSQFTLGTPSTPLPAALATNGTIAIPITFSPTATGPLGATLTAMTSAGKTATFALSGVGQAAAAKLEVTPPLVTFGGTTVGESLSAGATFRNVGGTALEINAVHLPAAPFGASGVPAVGSMIEPGDSITVTVTFEPSATGTFEGQIGLDTSGGDEAIGLTGSAGLPGALEITNEVSDFGEVPVGLSATRTFTVTNTGGTTVTITKSKPPVGGAFEAITALNEGTTIEPGESVTESVTFTPTAAGQVYGEWVINGNDTSGLHEVKFSGIGTVTEPPPPPEEEPPPHEEEPPPPPEEEPPAPKEEEPPAPKEEEPPAPKEEPAPEKPQPHEQEQPTPKSEPPAPTPIQAGLPAVGTLPFKAQIAPPSPEVVLGNTALHVWPGGYIHARVGCPASETRCAGTITLRTLSAIRATAADSPPNATKARILTLATHPFTLASGHAITVTLHLTPKARALLARVHVLRAQATIYAHDPAAHAHTTRIAVTIRKARASRPQGG